MCGVLVLGTVNRHSALSRSISAHLALRSSPGRNEHHGRQHKRRPDDRRALVAVQGAQQIAQLLRVGRRRKVPVLLWRQGAAQICRWVTVGSAGVEGIAEHQPAVDPRTKGGFEGATALYSAQHGQQFRGRYLGDWAVANPGENVTVKQAQHAVGVGRRPRVRKLGMPLSRDGLEAVGRRAGPRPLHRLPGFARVHTIVQLLPGLIPFESRVGQAHLRVGPKAEQLFLARESVFQPPQLPARGRDKNEHPAGVVQLVRRRLLLGLLERDV